MKNFFIIGIFTLVVVGYFLIDFNKLYQKFQGEGEYVTQSSECSLKQSSCSVVLDDGTTLELEIIQKDIPLMKPLDFVLKSSNKDLEDLSIKIYATNMMMGTFLKDFKNQRDGTFTTTVTLPTCIVGGMEWNADVQIHKLTKIVGGRFQFKTK